MALYSGRFLREGRQLSEPLFQTPLIPRTVTRMISAGEMSGHMFFAHRYFGFDDAIYAAARLVEMGADGGYVFAGALGHGRGYPSGGFANGSRSIDSGDGPPEGLDTAREHAAAAVRLRHQCRALEAGHDELGRRTVAGVSPVGDPRHEAAVDLGGREDETAALCQGDDLVHRAPGLADQGRARLHPGHAGVDQ